MRSLLNLVIAVGFVLGILKILVILLEPKMTFFPFREIDGTPSEFGIDFQEILIPTGDGETICAWYLPTMDPLAEILLFHGNAGNLSAGRLDLLASIYRQGYTLFAFDYRGYGRSTGSPSEKGLYSDSEAATSYFWDRLHRPGTKVIYFGRSLGGVTAAYAATVHRPDGLILEGTFADKASLLKHYPLLKILSLFSRYELPTLRFLRGNRCPVLIIHGERDRVVPFPVGRDLYEKLETKKEFYVMPEAGHADQYLVGGEDYWRRLEEFIQTLPLET